jgi:hypothetical protein
LLSPTYDTYRDRAAADITYTTAVEDVNTDTGEER